MSPVSTASRPEPAARPSIVAHPTVLTAIDFARCIGLRVSAPTLRAAFATRPEAPALRLAELVEVFDALGIPSAAFQSALADLPGLPMPLVAGLTDAEADDTREGPTLVTLLDCDGQAVRFVHPLLGEQRLAWPEFSARWNGILFTADADAFAGEPDFERSAGAERAEAAAFRNSIRLIDDFLTAAECAELIAYCECHSLFGRSVVESQDSEQPAFVSTHRSSDSALIRDAQLPLVARIRARAAALLGVELSQIEDLQCVRYLPGQHFAAHVDGRRRTFTLLVYLNQDFEQGETVFPDLDLAIAPRIGRALLFRNVTPSGTEIAQARHLGAAPANGTKYACNIWVRCGAGHAAPECGYPVTGIGASAPI